MLQSSGFYYATLGTMISRKKDNTTSFIPSLCFATAPVLYDTFLKFSRLGSIFFAKEVITEYNFKEKQLVLDIGSGTGTLLQTLIQKHPNLVVYGVDPDQKLIDFVNQRQSEQIQLKNMSVIVDGDVNSITIHGERNLLEVCFESLLDNALKYSPNGSKLNISIKMLEGQIICTFIDQGRGFTAETLSGIFELLSLNENQIEEIEAFDIALVKLIMDAHLGKMEVLNNENGGATIRLIFPDYNSIIKN